MKNKITKKLLVAMLIAVGYTNLQAQGIGVVDHKGTKNTLNNVTYGYTLAPTTTPETTKGDIYRKLKGGTGTDKDDVVNSYIYDGRNWVKLNRPAEAEVTGTEGSVFFANTDGTPTENNEKFFWDNNNKRLGIRIKTPEKPLDVNGKVKIRSFEDLSSIGTNKVVVVGTDGVLKKATLSKLTGTKGSVFFANTDGTPTEDNANFFWDNSNKNLKISKTVIGNRWIGIGEKLTTTTDTYLDFHSNGSTGQQSRIVRYRGANGDLSFENNGTGSVRFYHNGGNRLLIRSNGNVGIGTNNPTEKLEVNGKVKVSSFEDLSSIGTNKVVVVGTDGVLKKATLSKLTGTKGSVFFANTDGTPTEDNEKFFWDNNNKRLGIRIKTPEKPLDVNGKVKIRSFEDLSSIGTNKLVVVGNDGVLKKAAFPASSSPFQEGDFKWSNKTADHGNWKLCDGTDGTPDLRGRFLRMLPEFNTAPGAWNYQLARKYSSDNRTITIKKENIPNYTLPTAYTSYAGKHKHKEWVPGDFKKNAGTNSGTTSYASGSFQKETTEAGEHRHTVSVKSGGSGTGIKLDVIPGHYTLNIFMYKP